MTNQVLNQPPEIGSINLWQADPVGSTLALQGDDELQRVGEKAGSDTFVRWGFDANQFEPELRTHDRFGNRSDTVEFHPSWHHLLDTSVGMGITSLPYEAGATDTAHQNRAVRAYLVGQTEQGHMCPISMTYAAVPVLRRQPEVAALWEPRLMTRKYDPAFGPADQKVGALIGMGMTERQGGSDVQANTSVATPTTASSRSNDFLITGHKWFCSAPMNDAFLVLAQAPGGLSCFLLPRWTPDGKQNTFHIQRLKDKLGNRSNASSEVEFVDSWAQLLGEEGRGVATIIEMVNATRLDCVIGAAAIMRQAVTQATWHVANRRAFGRRLVDQPLMQNVIADLEIESQAATSLMLRLAGSFDRAPADEHEALIKRILTPVAKYWVTKRCSEVVREALECLGGGGYVEESIMPRLYRESPLNAIWEGSGNVIALDVLRAIAKEPRALEALLVELETTGPADISSAVDDFRREYGADGYLESAARRIVEQLGVLAAASALGRLADPGVVAAYVATRVKSVSGRLYGTLPSSIRSGDIAHESYARIEAARSG